MNPAQDRVRLKLLVDNDGLGVVCALNLVFICCDKHLNLKRGQTFIINQIIAEILFRGGWISHPRLMTAPFPQQKVHTHLSGVQRNGSQ
jgi:hypothetical protein